MAPSTNRPTKSKLTLPKIAVYAVAAVAVFLILRFVFSVAMSVMKFLILGALAIFVVWIFLAKDGPDKPDRS